MSRAARVAFLALVLAQACHSVEEYRNRLYDVLAPARYVSGLIAEDRRVGFVIFNAGLAALGLSCFFGPIRVGWASARAIAWAWAALEAANGSVHILWSVGARAYRPGLFTAPVLLAIALVLARQLGRDGASAPTTA